MTQSCLKCLKYTMCVVNLLCFICGTVLFGFGVHMMMNSKNQLSSFIPALANVNLASILFIIGIIITCVSFLGFLWAMKENRCLLITFFILLFLLMVVELTAACVLLVYETKIDTIVEEQLKESLKASKTSNSTDDWDFIQETFKCCGVNGGSDWENVDLPPSCCGTTPCHEKGCYAELKHWLEANFLSTGIGMIVLCVIEVLGMCFSMTLFCHIKPSGHEGYKL